MIRLSRDMIYGQEYGMEERDKKIRLLYREYLEASSESVREVRHRRLLDELKTLIEQGARQYGQSKEDRADIVQEAMVALSKVLLSENSRPEDIVRYAQRVARRHAILHFLRLNPGRRKANCRIRTCIAKKPEIFCEFQTKEHKYYETLTVWSSSERLAKKVCLDIIRAAGDFGPIIEKQSGDVPPGVAYERSRWRIDTSSAIWKSLNWCQGALGLGDLSLAVRALQADRDLIEVPYDPDLLTVQMRSEGLEIWQQLKVIWSYLKQVGHRDASTILLGKSLTNESWVEIFLTNNLVSETEMADFLQFGADDFKTVRKSLPWSNRQIAVHLGASEDEEQQVSNWRSQGRASIRRRLYGRND